MTTRLLQKFCRRLSSENLCALELESDEKIAVDESDENLIVIQKGDYQIELERYKEKNIFSFKGFILIPFQCEGIELLSPLINYCDDGNKIIGWMAPGKEEDYADLSKPFPQYQENGQVKIPRGPVQILEEARVLIGDIHNRYFPG